MMRPPPRRKPSTPRRPTDRPADPDPSNPAPLRMSPSQEVPLAGPAPAVRRSEYSPIGACPMSGSTLDPGFRLCWYEEGREAPREWLAELRLGAIELCLNLEGAGRIRGDQETVELPPGAWTIYRQGVPALTGERQAGKRHRFVTLEFSRWFLRQCLSGSAEHFHPVLGQFLAGPGITPALAMPERLRPITLGLVESLQHCPVGRPACETWFRGKAIELAAHLFYRAAPGDRACTRSERIGCERVARAQEILRNRLQEPPSLKELGRQVGCSPFHLSRLFSQVTGQTLQQYLRQIRLERAAELLRSGRCNVTEAAFEVGYNSLSHFSTAFREMFQCCPGLYPIRPRALPSPDSPRSA
ncbi:MAG: helix-turn-helix domain-containing protein [Verrucomicrobiales bacterium]|nr:helix-turn-helix domain-containing protein [Verrucomicrobiales bacterium]